ncbi:MAG: hypothetical protein HETSPECPRED_009296 [Heterodermia speciosa]|uniref:Uncharacterized protein n=1 Tax=Heterodermia speciosa TaxID=116794 RepID=A0A8H3IYQ2_9LECA|nr:MAG: hypothetical protein HETSPECPRED_009296 [Heterodermia speciosa]
MLPLFHKVRYTPLGERSLCRRPRGVLLLKYAALAFLTLLLLVLVVYFSGVNRILSAPEREEPPPPPPEPEEGMLGFARGPRILVPEIPKEFQTVGVVFYGRRSRVEILDCYLKQNLKENGGLLDEVLFVTKTTNVEDLEWLDQLIPTSKSYKKRILPDPGINFGMTWDIFERGKMYLKIDDDVIFIDNTTVSELISTKRNHPEYLLVSANGINNPALSWVHYHLGAIRPYLPELVPLKNTSLSWRASTLPNWKDGALFNRHERFDAPYENHRWLPLGPEYTLDGTPITTTAYDKSGPGWNNWAIAAQEHYSFLENLERGELWRYHFGIWDYQYERLSINMIAIWGDDVVDNLPFPEDDEQFLTVDLPRKLGRHSVMNGHAVASHYCFNAQRVDDKGLEWTDVLARYKSYADEKVCKR